jgi:hypothetical protein
MEHETRGRRWKIVLVQGLIQDCEFNKGYCHGVELTLCIPPIRVEFRVFSIRALNSNEFHWVDQE